ncbi:hypothetical protein KUCAC02_010688, partial [Chaenocephalus aceratus]
TSSQLAGKELNFCRKITPACVQHTGCGPLIPLRSSIHSAWAMLQMLVSAVELCVGGSDR